MPGSTSFTPNLITRKFVELANELIDNRKYDQSGLSKALDWNKTSLSSTMNGARNIPIPKWERFQEVYKSANTKSNSMSNEDKYVALLEKTNDTLTKNNEALITQIEYLQGEVKKCLSSIAENQVDASMMEISAHEVILQRLATDRTEYVKLWSDVHRKSVELAKDVRSKGNRIDLDIVNR